MHTWRRLLGESHPLTLHIGSSNHKQTLGVGLKSSVTKYRPCWRETLTQARSSDLCNSDVLCGTTAPKTNLFFSEHNSPFPASWNDLPGRYRHLKLGSYVDSNTAALHSLVVEYTVAMQ